MSKFPPVGAENKGFNSGRVGVDPWLLLDLLTVYGKMKVVRLIQIVLVFVLR